MATRRVLLSVTEAAIDAARLLALTQGPGDGAVVTFIGAVRNHNHGRAVRAVSYDAEPALAEHILGEIAHELDALGGGADLALTVVHRVGRLLVGEISVAVLTASAHRALAYAANRHVIEALKRRLPVWKQEHYVDGDSAWLDGCCLAPEAPELRLEPPADEPHAHDHLR